MNRTERGAALIVIMAGLSLILLVLLTGLTMTSYSGQMLKRQLVYQGQAMNAASAGLEESLSWFRRQSTQPVTNFNPLLDVNGVCTHTPVHNPPINDTDDPSIGIVREYELSADGRVQGRYEVRKTACSATSPSCVQDMSYERGKATADDGTVWHLKSEGIVYVQNNSSVAYNVAPNVVLARRTMETDVQRLQIRPPANAAIFATRGDRISVNASVRVRGGGSIGAAYAGATAPTYPAGSITGSPITNTTANGYDVPAVFALSTQELLQTADIVAPSATAMPPDFPQMGLVVIQGDATFGPTAPFRPLRGTGILVVFGNLTIQQDSLSLFSGLIYVTGTVNIAQPASISGAVIVATPTTTTGNYLTLTGSADFVEINYDPAILNQLAQQMGQYRFIRSFYTTGGQL